MDTSPEGRSEFLSSLDRAERDLPSLLTDAEHRLELCEQDMEDARMAADDARAAAPEVTPGRHLSPAQRTAWMASLAADETHRLTVEAYEAARRDQARLLDEYEQAYRTELPPIGEPRFIDRW